MIEKQLGHYDVIEKLGESTTSVAYKVKDTRTGRSYHLTILLEEASRDPDLREKFHRQAQLAGHLVHPGIAITYDIDEIEGRLYAVAELPEGKLLSHLIPSEGFSLETIINIGSQIADALAYAHKLGVVHRDLKPSNLLIQPGYRVKILDFGLTRAERFVVDEVTVGVAPGTIPYVPPEQLRGGFADNRTDIYALGAVLYELGAGRPPFSEPHTPLTYRLVRQAIIVDRPTAPRLLNPRLPAELENIILKCLEKDPEKRYQSVEELAADLRKCGKKRTEERPRFATPASLALVDFAALGAVPLLHSAARVLATKTDRSLPRKFISRESVFVPQSVFVKQFVSFFPEEFINRFWITVIDLLIMERECDLTYFGRFSIDAVWANPKIVFEPDTLLTHGESLLLDRFDPKSPHEAQLLRILEEALRLNQESAWYPRFTRKGTENAVSRTIRRMLQNQLPLVFELQGKAPLSESILKKWLTQSREKKTIEMDQVRPAARNAAILTYLSYVWAFARELQRAGQVSVSSIGTFRQHDHTVHLESTQEFSNLVLSNILRTAGR